MSIMPDKPPLLILVLATAVGPMAINIFLPSMPRLEVDLSTSYAMVQLTLSLYLVGLAVAQLAYGPLSDRYGRRPLMITGVCIFLVGTVICIVAPSITILIIGRVLQAIGGCAGVVLGRAIVRDMYDRDKSASMLAYITMSMVVAPMLSPTIGGLIDEYYGWRYSFVFVFAFASVVLIGCFFLLAETHGVKRRLAIANTGIRSTSLFKIPAFYCYTFQLSFTSVVFYGFLGGAPYIVVKLMGHPPSVYGLYFIIVSFCYMAGNFTAARVSTRFGTDRMITLGAGLSLIGGLLLGLIYLNGMLSVLSLFVCMGVVALGNGMSIPNGIAGAISVDPDQAGAASGISGFTQMAFGAMATTLVGNLLADTAGPLIIVMVIAGILSFLIHIIGLRFFHS